MLLPVRACHGRMNVSPLGGTDPLWPVEVCSLVGHRGVLNVEDEGGNPPAVSAEFGPGFPCLQFGPPKSEAGCRTVTIPAAIRDDIGEHLRTYVSDNSEALIFTSARGTPLRRGNFHRATSWTSTVKQAGLPGFHFHDLRHTGNMLAASTGASLADLMARMGHGSARAALIYQHASREQDRLIADALSDRIGQEQERAHTGHAGGEKHLG